MLLSLTQLPMTKRVSPCQLNQKRRPRWLRNLRFYFMEYCNNTSIHGFKYLGERRSSIEKIWWTIVITTSFSFCIWMIMKIYQKWERSPVLVSFATSVTPIWDVPFPAITICPRTKAVKSKFNFTQMVLLNNKTAFGDKLAIKLKEFEYMSLVCSSKFQLYSDKKESFTVDDEALSFLMSVQPKFEDTIVYFSWLGRDYTKHVNEMFVPIITSDGVCHSFNFLDLKEIFTPEMDINYYKSFYTSSQPPSQWSVEKGYDANSDIHAFPRRTLVSGKPGGVDLMLATSEDDLDYVCGDALQGYKIILHHPGQTPNPKQDYFRLGLNQDVAVGIKPNMMTTSDELKGYNYQDRSCYLTHEKKLRFFKVYDQHECLLECLSNWTYKYCDCVGFYMPRDNSTPICGAASKNCIDYSYSKFLSNEISFKIEHPDHKAPRNLSEKGIDQDCNCLPDCYSLGFDAEVSLSDWQWHKGIQIVSPKNGSSDKQHLSRLSVFFKDMQFIKSQRNELYGSTDFVANCGGLLGLFTGFSLISLVELIYFATLRFALNFRKHGKHRWSGAAEMLVCDEE